MALVVEDGTGRADAESYVSVDEADVYHAVRLNTLWATLSTAEKEASLRRATDYMVLAYRDLWDGTRRYLAQALDWPRADVPIKDAPYGYGGFASVWPDDEVPLLVRQACALMAFKAASGDLVPDVGTPVKSEQVGPIQVVYQDGARQTVRYQAIDRMLASFLSGGSPGMMVRIYRA